MTKEEFSEWKQASQTKEILEIVRQYARRIEVVLAREAGLNPLSDRFKVGVLAGLDELLNIEWEDETNAEETTGS